MRCLRIEEAWIMEKKKTIVVALGHKALGRTLPEQKTATREWSHTEIRLRWV